MDMSRSSAFKTPLIHNTALTITPISARNIKGVQNPALRDYTEQMSCVGGVVWDDSKHNKSLPGDFLGFWFYKKKVVIHTILMVSPPSERLPSWSTNVGQGDRNVLSLSHTPITIPWETWISLNGAKRCMGTSTVLKGLADILSYIES